jgi:hypothetical protein
MQDPRDRQLRYLVHFADRGSGMRRRDEPLEPGAEPQDGGAPYRVVHVAQASHPYGLGHAWLNPSGAERARKSRPTRS